MSNDTKCRADTNGFEIGGPMSQTGTYYPKGVAAQREYPGSWEIAACITKDGLMALDAEAKSNYEPPAWRDAAHLDLDDVNKLIEYLTRVRDEMDAAHRKAHP